MPSPCLVTAVIFAIPSIGPSRLTVRFGLLMTGDNVVALAKDIEPLSCRLTAELPVLPKIGALLAKLTALPTVRLVLSTSKRVPAAMVSAPVPKGPEARGPPPVVAELEAPRTMPPELSVTLTPPVNVLAPDSCKSPAPEIVRPDEFWITALTIKVGCKGAMTVVTEVVGSVTWIGETEMLLAAPPKSTVPAKVEV